MKHTYRFVGSIGTVTCRFPSGNSVELPVVPGILKHPTPAMLPGLLKNPNVAYKYTLQALRKASWPILSQFPKNWLKECIDAAQIPPSRRKALIFLLA